MLVVAAAMIRSDHTILIQKRPPGKALAGKWEFPGGKVEAGETCRNALCRELAEELGITVAPQDLSELGFVTEPRHTGELILLLFACSAWTGTIVPQEATDIAWLHPALLLQQDLAPLDIMLARQLSRQLG